MQLPGITRNDPLPQVTPHHLPSMCKRPRHPRLLSRGLGLLLFGAPIVLAGCSGTTDSSEVEVRVEKNVTQWTLLSDAYFPPPIGLRDYAVDVEARECVERLDVTMRMARFDPEAPLPRTQNAGVRNIFNPEIAAEFGYRSELDPRINWENHELMAGDQSLTDPATYEAWITCQREAEERLGVDPEAMLSFGFPVEAADANPNAIAAEGKWRECMAPLGIADLAPDASPLSGIASTSLFQQWGLSSDSPPWEITQPSEEEIRIAVHDANCRDSSGWTEARYEAEWNAEIDYLTKHYRDLEAQRLQYEEQHQNFLNVLAANPADNS